jgi:exodeoxyribonuclease X
MIIQVIDFETTGTEPPALVIEAGVASVVDGVPQRWLSQLYGADKVPAETRAIHHIGIQDLANRERFDPKEFSKEWAGETVSAIAAHHADFEGKWLGPVLGTTPMVCTYKAALRLWPEAPSHSNQCLRYWLEEKGLTSPDAALCQPAHRAGPDAYATAHLLAAELKLATLGELIAWTAEPRLLPTIPIGKQRGAKWQDVEEGFLRWMLRTADMDSDLKWNAQREIDRRSKKS